MYKKILKRRTAGEGDPSTMQLIKTLCPTCKHFNRVTAHTCTAFPKGIPWVILLGRFDHNTPYDDGEIDDHGIQYQRREKPNQ